jgi:hypothetical protein
MGTFDDMGEQQDRERRRRGELHPWEKGRYDSNGDPIQSWQRNKGGPPIRPSSPSEPSSGTPSGGGGGSSPRPYQASSGDSVGFGGGLVGVVFFILLIGVIVSRCSG